MPEFVTKQAFLRGRECLTQGWFVHHTPSSPPKPGLGWRYYVGADVAKRARTWLGNGRLLPTAPLERALQSTKSGLETEEVVLLFEASFTWDGMVARADALRRSESGWTLIEVKSGKTPSDGRVKAEYLDDIAYTFLVCKNAGVPLVAAKLVLINREYTMGGSVGMFEELDVTKETDERVSQFTPEARDIASTLAGATPPAPYLKFACRACEFFEVTCIGRGVPDPLFALPRLSEKRFKELEPYERVSRIPSDIVLTENQRRVADVIRAGQAEIDHRELSALDQLAWPAYYLDFEVVMPHIPWFEDRPPYDPSVFQYSIHLVHEPGGDPQHREYLAPIEDDWRRDMVDQLLRDLGTEGSIIVYSSYEKAQLTRLGKLFPDVQDRLDLLIERLVDFEPLFRRGYIHPEFCGSSSIKRVLPVMVPELRYDDLEVTTGDDAAGIFGLMRVGEYPPATHEGYRARLREYCERDTMAMVELHRALDDLRGRASAQGNISGGSVGPGGAEQRG